MEDKEIKKIFRESYAEITKKGLMSYAIIDPSYWKVWKLRILWG